MKFVFFIFVVLFSVSPVFAQNTSRFPLMVYFKSQPDFRALNLVTDRSFKMKTMYRELVSLTRQTQSAVWNSLAQRRYAYRSFYINNSLLVSNADAELVAQLRASPEVRKVAFNASFRVKPIATPGSKRKEILKVGDNLRAIKADQVWPLNITGQGIVVGSNDSGAQWNHPALVRQYRGFNSGKINHHYSWHDAIRKQTHPKLQSACGYNLVAPCDDTGHGTHTTGTILGSDGKTIVTGVAPSAQWMACRNMDNGVGTIATYIECFEFFFAPYPVGGNSMMDGRPELAPHIINNSWGCSAAEGCTGDELLDVLYHLYTAGIMVVVSAGNNGPDCSSIDIPPAGNSQVTLAVGSVDSRNEVSLFSARGPSAMDRQIGPDLVAPGEYISSSLPGNTYMERSGTSMASPHISGVVALMWSGNKKLIGRLQETEIILKQTATPIRSSETCGGLGGSAIPNNSAGYGLVNSLLAVKKSLNVR